MDFQNTWIPSLYGTAKARIYNTYRKNKEIDFVCEKNKSKIYVHVSYILSTPENVQREFEPLEKVQYN